MQSGTGTQAPRFGGDARPRPRSEAADPLAGETALRLSVNSTRIVRYGQEPGAAIAPLLPHCIFSPRVLTVGEVPLRATAPAALYRSRGMRAAHVPAHVTEMR